MTRASKRRSEQGALGQLIVRRRTRPGASPGALVVDAVAPAPVIDVLAFGREGIEEGRAVPPAALASWLRRQPVVWINVDGLGDASVLAALGALAGIHPLALEDVVNVHQRPKVEDYGEHLFVVVRMPHRDGPLRTEQVSLIVRDGLVVSFQEIVGDCLDPIRERLRKGSGRVRARGADYLAYAILDAITDAYFPVLEAVGDELEDIEEQTLTAPEPDTVAQLHQVRRELLQLRRAIWPLRELFHALQRGDAPIVTEETRVYLRDCYDHVAQLIDITESYREVVAGLLDVYLSSVSNRMNEVMKVLTIVATVFIPLTFVAGVYGMNFDRAASPWNMPELGWFLGYPLCLLLMAAMGIGMLLYFRRLGWLGGVARPRSD